jgi:uncharacterized protein
MNIAISGASGLVGGAILKHRAALGDEIHTMKRDPEGGRGAKNIFWNAEVGAIDENAFEGLDAVIHLAGENIAGGPWTETRKEEIRYSRVRGTWLVAGALSHLKKPPRVLLVASAVGYYGDRGDEILTEESESGDGFLAEVCREWECATELALAAGIRVVHLRFGVILDREKGMLPRLLPLFRTGLGGRAGRGRQFMSWIAISDLVKAIDFLLEREDLAGPVNMCAPNPVRNSEFASTLGRVLHRPSVVSVPAPLLKLATGKMAEEMILASARAVPARLTASGFQFDYPELEPALRHLLERNG